MPRNPRPRKVKIVRYHLPDGTRCRKGDPGAVRTTTLSETYYWHTRDRRGRPVRISLGTADEGEAWERLRRLRRAGARELDPVAEAARRPLAEHLGAFAAHLRDKGASARQAKVVRAKVARLAALAGWSCPADITAASCLSALARLAHRGRPAAPQTRNHYLAAARNFVHWCLVPPRKLPEDPLAGVRPAPVAGDLRHPRREPTAAEIDALFAYLEGPGCPRRAKMSGPHRGLGYKICMATGLRAGELRHLSRGSFDLDAQTVTAHAAYSRKSHKTCTLPLPAWLADELRDHFAAGRGCWESFPEDYPGKVLKKDLAAAGVAWETPAGFFDFHALRHWYISHVAAQPGMDLKTLLHLTRHSDPRLSLQVYAHARAQQARDAVERLPRPGK